MEIIPLFVIFAPDLLLRTMTLDTLKALYEPLSDEELYQRIMQRGDDSEAAVYYLLRYRLLRRLRYYYSRFQLREDFGEVLDGFHFYLRDGKNKSFDRPYQPLESLRSEKSFTSFVIQIFKNYLISLAEEEKTKKEAKEELEKTPIPTYDKVRDKKIYCFGVLLAFANQRFGLRERFILFRSLLDVLDKKQMISNKMMAEAMNLTYGNYRQIDSRMRGLSQSLLQDFEAGNLPQLDDTGKQLVVRVNREYEQVGKILNDLYEATLNQMECKPAIVALRDKMQSEAELGHMYSVTSPSLPLGSPEAKKKRRERILIQDGTSPIIRKPKRRQSREVSMDFSDLNAKNKLWNKLQSWLVER